MADLDNDGGDTLTTFSDGVVDNYEAWIDVDSENYLRALGSMFEQVYNIVEAQGDPDDSDDYTAGWSTLLDPDVCPASFLPFLAQFNGTDLPPGIDETTARLKIKLECAQLRGTVASMKWQAQQNLTGTQFLQVKERTGPDGVVPDAYHMVFTFRVNECPSVPALIAAVELRKPAGIQITYQSTAGYTWNSAVNSWSSDTMTWDQTLATQP